jgi:uncharacterized protein (TIGR03437 family)
MKRTIIVTSILAALLLFAISTTRDVRLSKPVSAQAQVTTGCAVPSFAAMETVTAGAKPVAATTGDFNQDGKLDAVVANYDAGNISIYLGDGGGGLASPVNFSAGIRPVAVAKADFNRDGKMDLVITNSGSNNITILLNSPGMKFYPSVIIATGLSPRLTVVGDFNRDGKADLAVVNRDSNNISVFPGNGNGTFGSATNFAVASQPVSITINDFNHDGKADLVVGSNRFPNLTFLFGDGNGGFNTPTALGIETQLDQPINLENVTQGEIDTYDAIDVISRDLDRDGNPDLVWSLANLGIVQVALGDGKGGFGAASSIATGRLPGRISIGDVNGDGKPDLAVGSLSSNSIKVMLGDGAGAFPQKADYPVISSLNPSSTASLGNNLVYSPSAIWMDYEGIEAIIGNDRQVYMEWMDYEGIERASSPGDNRVMMEILMYEGIDDFNGDGRRDLLVVSSLTNTVGVMLNSCVAVQCSAVSFAPKVDYAGASGATAIVAGDFNLDGNADLATANWGSHNISIYSGDGAGIFTRSNGPALGSGTSFFVYSMAVADFNLDGKQDLAVASEGESLVRIFLGDGKGAFTAGPNSPITVASGPYSIAAADLNLDGKPDLVTANRYAGSVTILRGLGNGGLVVQSSIPSGGDSRYAAVGDFNRDGKPDLAVSNSLPTTVNDTVTIMHGDGNLGFTIYTSVAVGDRPRNIVVADFNGDGIQEIAVVSEGNDNVALVIPNPVGGYSVAKFPAGDLPVAIKAGDYNRDGKIDIATANFNSSNVSVLIRNLSGGFNTPSNYPTGSQPHSMISIDLNKDGRADLSTANLNSSNISVLINNCGSLPFANIETAPSKLDFGAVPLGQSRDLSIVIRNTGTASTSVVGLSASPAVFGILPHVLPANLAPGAEAVFTVRFNPTTFNNQAGTLTITSTGSVQTIVPLSGLAICGFVLSEQSQTFDAAGGQGTITATGSSSCSRTAVSNQSWITVTSGGSGSGNGTVGFTVSPNTASGPRTGKITIGDQDFVVIQSGTGGIGAPCSDINFADPYFINTYWTAHAVEAADFNNDGNPDLVAVSTSPTSLFLLTYLGNGKGALALRYTFSPGYGSINDAELLTIAVADFNKDGNQDVAIASPGIDSVLVFRGIGNGSFQSPSMIKTGSQPLDIAALDYNHDGNPDMVTANHGGKNLTFLPGDGKGAFGTSVSLDLYGFYPRSVTIGDFNNDGLSDIAVVSQLRHTIQIFIGKGTFFNYVGINNAWYEPASATVGDFNNDGKADLAVAKLETGGSILLGRGDGTFEAERSLGGSGPYYSVVAADFNANGKTDLAFTNVGVNEVEVYENQGGAVFSATPKSFPVGLGPYSLTTANFDIILNNKPDLATANAGSSNLAILLNSCRGLPTTDLSITKTNNTDVVIPGTDVTYTIVVTNNGPDAVTGAKVMDQQSSELTNFSWTCVATSGSACGAASGAGNIDTTVNLLNGGRATFTLKARVSPAVYSNLINAAFVTEPSGIIDPDPLNNSALDTDRVNPIADLHITKAAIYPPVEFQAVPAGDKLIYELVVSNSGPSTSLNATVRNDQPAQVISISWTCTAIAGATCRVSGNTGPPNTLVALVPGGSAKITIVETINPAATGSVTNNAIAYPELGVTDPNTSDNTISNNYLIGKRLISLKQVSGLPGSVISIPVYLESYGNENAIGFSTGFEPAVLSKPDAVLGPDAVGASLVLNKSRELSGDLGIGLALPSGQTFTKGRRHILTLNYTISDMLINRMTEIELGDYPVKAEVVDDKATVLYAFFNGTIVDIIVIYEADVAPRPNGNGELSIADWAQVGRFVTGLDTAAIGSEFQRADCAPGSTKGNGILAASDWSQAGRYAVGLDPPTLVGGPTEPTIPLFAEFRLLTDNILMQAAREVRMVSSGIERGMSGNVSVEFAASGTENSFSFTLSFDPSQLTYVKYENGSGIAGATVLVNAAQAAVGKLGVAIALPPGQSMTAGVKQLLSLTFTAREQGNPGTTAIGFANQPVQCEVADVNANPLGCGWTDMNLSLLRTVVGVSAANYGTDEQAAESIIAAFGRSMATTTMGAPGRPLPTELGGTTVKVRDSLGFERLSPLFYVSPTQVNFQIPAGTAVGDATFTITSSDGTISIGTMKIASVVPALFSADSSGQGLAAAWALRVKPDGSLIYEPVAAYDPMISKFKAVPIDFGPAGDQMFLVLYGTGIRGRSSLSAVNALIGGESHQVVYAGLQGDWVGLDQVNITLPRSLAGRGEVDVILMVDTRSSNTVRVQFK